MEIIYIITVLWLFISTMLVKKSDKKENVLLRGVLNIILFTSYNILLTLILSVFKIPGTMLILSIANSILCILNTVILVKKKEVQKYFIRIKDVVFLIILLVCIVGLAYKQYEFPFKIKYETTDPAMHFAAAKDFYNEKIVKLDGGIIGASVNTGILFDTFDFIVDEQDFYCLFIIFDLIMLYLIGAIFYLGITNKVDGKIKSIFAMIFSLIFVFAYPLNSVLFGYSYLTLGILYMTTLITVAFDIKDKKQKLIPLCTNMFLIVFGIFFSYYLFVPVIYSAFGLYMLFNMIANRKKSNIFSIITKENVIKVLVILILPTIIGFCYFVLPGLLSTGETSISIISLEGYIYRDLYSNFVLFAPLALYYVIYKIKNKENSFSTILTILTCLFTLVLLKRGLRGDVSSYYYFKMYFLIWILVFYMNVKALFIMFENKDGVYAYSFSIIILALLGISYTGFDYKVSSINILFNPYNSINSYTNIYAFNQNKVNSDTEIYSKKQLDAVRFILDKAENKKEILINGAPLQMLWANSAWKITDTEDVRQLQIQEELNMNNWLENNDKKYLIYLYSDKQENQINNENENYKTIYKTDGAIVLEKVKGNS